jgi:16S rRNA (guanine527-N7)-methyltransferase
MMHTFQEEYKLTEEQLDQFQLYYRLLFEKNKVMNLTSITEENEVYMKHFYDSLTISRAIHFSDISRMIDVGTGAGFPGIPLKIAFPHLKLTLLDSLLKRVTFLQEVGEALGLTDIQYVHGRAEDIAMEAAHREQYDLVASRAVARLHILTEYCLPFARVGGKFVAFKGVDVGEEISSAKQALSVLGDAEQQVYSLDLPEQMGHRNLIIIQKNKRTPKKYPRKSNMIKKAPL